MRKKYSIRPYQSSDIISLNKIRTDPRVCHNILSMPTETILETERYFSKDLSRYYTLVAVTIEDDPQVIGYFKIAISKNPRKHHRGNISIAVAPDYQSNGVGKKLFESGIQLTKDWLMLHKLELSVLANNIAAIKLYEAYNFEIEGKLIDDTLVNGKYEDVYRMGLII